MDFIADIKSKLLGSTEQASAGHSASELETTATVESQLPYGWFDDYRRANQGNYSQLRLEKAEHPEFSGATKVHKVQFVKCKISQGKVFVTWFFPELSTINVEGKKDRIVTLTTEGSAPSSEKGALRKAMSCLRGLRLIEADDEFLHPKFFAYIERETGLSVEDLSDKTKFDPSSKDNFRPYKIPGLILNIVNHTSETLMNWFQDKEFNLKELSGVDLMCKLSSANGKTFIMSKSGTRQNSRKANGVKAVNQVDAIVSSDEDDDF